MSANVHIDVHACDAEKNKGQMIGVASGGAAAFIGHYLLKKQMPAYAVPGSYMYAKIGAAVGIPLLAAWYLGDKYYKDCRSRNYGLNPPRIATTTTK